MDAQSWGMARQLFEAAVELPPEEWDAWLAAHCEHVEMREEVRAMLEGDLRASESDILPVRVSEFIAHYGPRRASRSVRSG